MHTPNSKQTHSPRHTIRTTNKGREIKQCKMNAQAHTIETNETGTQMDSSSKVAAMAALTTALLKLLK